jgi:hypothetical protein
LVIYDLTFLICHFVQKPEVFQMENDKCQMIYDQ